MTLLHVDNLGWGNTLSDYQGRYEVASGSVGFGTTNPPFPGTRYMNFGGQTAHYLRTKPFTPSAVIYGSLRIRWYAEIWTGASTVIEFVDDGTVQCGFAFQSNSGDIHFRRGSAISGTTLQTLSGYLAYNEWTSFQFKVVLNSVSGEAELRRNGATTTNIMRLTGINTISTVNPYANKMVLYGNAGSLFFNAFDIRDFIVVNDQGSVNNTWPGDVRTDILLPNGAGSSTGFGTLSGAATNWQSNAEFPNNGDTSYIQSSVVGSTDLYTMSNVPVAPHRVISVRPFSLMKKMYAGSRVAGVRLKSGATTITSVTHDYLTQTYNIVDGQLHTTDPDTGLTWTDAAVNALEAGPRLEA